MALNHCRVNIFGNSRTDQHRQAMLVQFAGINFYVSLAFMHFYAGRIYTGKRVVGNVCRSAIGFGFFEYLKELKVFFVKNDVGFFAQLACRGFLNDLSDASTFPPKADISPGLLIPGLSSRCCMMKLPSLSMTRTFATCLTDRCSRAQPSIDPAPINSTRRHGHVPAESFPTVRRPDRRYEQLRD